MTVIPIEGSTRLMGIIGDPIAQARTPEAINPLFARMNAGIVCVPLHVPITELETIWAGLKALPNLVGFGITLPHKQSALALCDRLDPLAELVGAVNVVRREADGAFCGYQFDGRGFVGGLVKQGIKPKGRSVTMIGAGGAAMAIAAELVLAGVSRLTIVNRTRHKAEALATRINEAFGAGRVTAATAATPQPDEIWINATSLGMKPDDPLPISPDALQAGMTVAEVIAKPETTRLLEHAERLGCRTHSGLHMIHGQVGAIAAHLAETGA
ncbi:shikimate dehydrogenase [Nitratireductor sp. GISD-1A_MAKvit]|uniref:shikimate dehydrogenase family protein n=1 Tax=Nitratireductor sp. GISD-1A_MAKvit TaxID=3234198 RepID=UPI0034667FED